MKHIIFILIFTIFLNIIPVYASETQLDFNAESIYVAEYFTDRCLYEKNAYDQRAMASTTKIMTAIIVIENDELDKIVKVSKNATNTEGSSMNLKTGEEISVNDLLYGLLIKSGNDAAVALAEAVAGSIEDFCILMNNKAEDLGAYDTHFTSPHGLDDDNHYSTARDLAIITKYALKYDLFKNIVSTKNTSVNNHYLGNTNDLIWSYDEVLGVKTGYTSNAGRCIVLLIEKNDLKLIAVIMGCKTSDERTKDGKKILDYFPGNYSVKNIVEAGAVIDTLKCIKCFNKYVSVVTSEEITLCLSQGEISNLTFKKVIFDEYKNGIKTSLKAGSTIGYYYVFSEGKIIETTELILAEKVENKGFIDFINDYFYLLINKTFTLLYSK